MSLNFTFPKECKTKDFTVSITLEETKSLNSIANFCDSEYGELYRKNFEDLGIYSLNYQFSGFFNDSHPGNRLIKTDKDGLILKSQIFLRYEDFMHTLNLNNIVSDVILDIQLDPFYVDEKTTYYITYIIEGKEKYKHVCESGEHIPLFICPYKGKIVIKGSHKPSLCCNVEYLLLKDRRTFEKK